jgi:fatty acid desaturase
MANEKKKISDMTQKLTDTIKKLMDKVKKFSTFDFVVLMIVLLSLGTLFGAHLSLSIRNNLFWLTLIMIIFAVSATYMPYIIATRIRKCAETDATDKSDSCSAAEEPDSAAAEEAPNETAKTGKKCCCMQKFVEMAKNFSICDFTMFKLYLFSIGIIFGILVSPLLIKFIWVMWIIFIGSCSYVSYVSYKKMKEE